MIQISNSKIVALIDEKGAELQSLQSNGIEYIWQADPKYWGKHSPVLFPIVGQLKDGKYVFKGKEYELPRHGFARDKTFTVECSKDTAVFMFRRDEDTLSKYPFHFVLKIEYKLKSNELFCTYIVQNIDVKDIYFSVGGHPAFNVPLASNLRCTDYSLQFNNDDVLNRYVLHDGLTGDNTKAIELDNKLLHLTPSLFYDDAIVLKHIKSDQIKLMTTKDKHGIKFSFEKFPYFGIWAAKDAPFVCLEPWCGIADNIHHDYHLTTKEGVNVLNVGEFWQRTWSVELF